MRFNCMLIRDACAAENLEFQTKLVATKRFIKVISLAYLILLNKNIRYATDYLFKLYQM